MTSCFPTDPGPYRSAPQTTRLRVLKGQVNGDRVALDVRGDYNGVEGLVLAVLDLEGGVETVPLPLGSPAPVCEVMMAPRHGIVDRMQVFGRFDGELLRLVPESGASGLERLLCRDMDQINRHIRWNGRIEDFPTRVFAAMNSYRHLQARVELAVYCLVSIGYTALERKDQALARTVFGELRKIFKTRLDELKGEARFSFLTHLMHHAMYFGKVPLFEKIVQLNLDSLEQIPAEPAAASNAMVMLLLSGIYHYESGTLTRAAEVFAKGDAIFRMAVASYPRDLAKFRDLVMLCRQAYLAQIGLAASRGGKALRPDLGITMFDVETVAGEVCRLNGAGPSQRAAAWLMALVQARRNYNPGPT